MTPRLLVAAATTLVVLLVGAAPAAAHGGPGGDDPPASNYRSRILAVEPEVDGVAVRLVEAGARVELVNRTDDDVVVRGYEGEPYLRVGPDGVFENVRSTAVYLNADRYGDVEVPDRADNDAEPDWRRVDGGRDVRWHDHRAHWMGGQDPPAVREDRGEQHVVIPEWTIPLEAGDTEIAVRGDLTWVPAPSPWPWYGVALVAVGALVGAAWLGRWRRPLRGAAAVLTAAVVVDVIGTWDSIDTDGFGRVTGLVVPVGAVAAIAWGVTSADRRPRTALAAVGAGAASLALSFGVASADWLQRSQLPTDLPTGIARLTVAVALGAGIGVAALAVLLLLRPSRDAP